MLEEFTTLASPRIIHQPDVPLVPPAGQERVPEQPLPPADLQHVQAVDAVFSQDEDSSKVAGLMGVWLGGPPVLDMMAEQFRKTDEEDEAEEAEPKPRPAGEP